MNKDFEFDHVGIAVESIEQSMGFYKSLGLIDTHIEEVESEKVKVAMMTLANKAKLELLESTDPEGPIAKYLQKKGPGIHHICIRVKNIEKTMDKLKNEGVRLLNEEPKMGAHNCKVAFIHPKSAGGVLVELSEPQGGE